MLRSLHQQNVLFMNSHIRQVVGQANDAWIDASGVTSCQRHMYSMVRRPTSQRCCCSMFVVARQASPCTEYDLLWVQLGAIGLCMFDRMV